MLNSIATSVGPMNDKLRSDSDDQKVRNVAIKLEATFLSEMLKSAGIGGSSKIFGGGPGEDQFSSFLRDAQAVEMARSGGIGLADALYKSMKENSDG
jgi:Rod binding domain-containing protein